MSAIADQRKTSFDIGKENLFHLKLTVRGKTSTIDT